MLHIAARARCLGRRLPASFSPLLQKPASTRPVRQIAKPPRTTKPAKTYLPRRANPNQLPSPPAPPTTLETADAIFKARKIPLLASGVVALGLGIYLSLLVSSFYSLPCCEGSEPAVPTGRPNVFTKESARKFDQSLDGSEWLMGITSLRRRLAAEASGHVLEVAMGTGRNLSFYDWSAVLQPVSTLVSSTAAEPAVAPSVDSQTLNTISAPISSYTGVDISGEMLGVAIEKIAEAVPQLAGVEPRVDKQTSNCENSWGVFSYLSDRLRIFRSDIHDFIPPPPQQLSTSPKYDFVCSTFSLCSVRDPEQVVRELASVVKPETGRIILVEHGRGWWGFINGLLDRSAASHFQKYGCWWNRDIAEIVESAAKLSPGLEVVKVDRPYITQLGTTFLLQISGKRVPKIQFVDGISEGERTGEAHERQIPKHR